MHTSHKPIQSVYVQALAKGDIGAYNKIYKRYASLLYTISYQLLRDKALAQDCTQEIFIDLWTNRERYCEALNFEGYLATATRNRAKLYAKEKKMHVMCEIPEFLKYNDFAAFEYIYVQETKQVIDKVINTLPPQQQYIFQLREEGFTHEQIGTMLNITMKTVSNTVFTVLKKLKQSL